MIEDLPTLHVRDEYIFFGSHNTHRPSRVFTWVWDKQSRTKMPAERPTQIIFSVFIHIEARS